MRHFRPISEPTTDPCAALIRKRLAEALDVEPADLSDHVTLGHLTEENPWGDTARGLAIAEVDGEFGITLPDEMHEADATIGKIIAAVIAALAARAA